jgi:site-specific DNA recombinase
VTVALYVRLSPRPDGSYEGVDRQEAWGRAYAARVWPGQPVEVFADAGISAANGDHRAGYEALRDAIAAGDVTQLWTVEQSRLERTELGWFGLAAELDAAGIREVHTDRDGIVRVGDDAAGIKAVLAAGEVRRLRRRVNDTLESLAAQGRPHGGHHVAYRHTVDEHGDAALEPIPEIADHVRWAADRVLAGWTLSAVAREMEARGVPTVKGGPWSNKSVKGMLVSPMVAGYRTHKGEVVRRGNWEPVLDEVTWRAVCARLDRTKAKARRYLLSGVAVCGRCDAGLTGRLRQAPNGKSKPFYYCALSTGGCGRLGILAQPLEDHVTAELLDALDDPRIWAGLAADEHQAHRAQLAAELEAIEQQHIDLAKRWARGDLPAAAWDAARTDLEARTKSGTAELAAIPAPVAVPDLAILRTSWDGMTLEEQRELIGLFIDRVVITPATPGAQHFDPARATIGWRTP